MATLLERIWAKTDRRGPDECWPWLGGCGGKGTPNISIKKKTFSARRLLWQELNGPLPKIRQVATTCGLFKCLNPAHLYLRPWMDHEARFWSFVDKTDGCWIWTGTLFSSGYGAFKVDDLERQAHRVVLEMVRGENLSDISRVVLHHCDNPPCVNPDHLSIGTHADNNADMWRKGRGSCGPKHGEAVKRARERKAS